MNRDENGVDFNFLKKVWISEEQEIYILLRNLNYVKTIK